MKAIQKILALLVSTPLLAASHARAQDGTDNSNDGTNETLAGEVERAVANDGPLLLAA